MGYQAIVDKIRAVAVAVNADGFFVHGRRSDGSIEYDAAFPQIHLYPFTTTISQIDGFDSSEIVMGFWYQDSPESTVEERETIIANADTLCRSFLDALLASQARIDNIRTDPQYRSLSGTLSGYGLRFTLTTKHATC